MSNPIASLIEEARLRLSRFAQSSNSQSARDVATMLLHIEVQRQERVAERKVIEKQHESLKEARAVIHRQDATIKALSFTHSVQLRVAS